MHSSCSVWTTCCFFTRAAACLISVSRVIHATLSLCLSEWCVRVWMDSPWISLDRHVFLFSVPTKEQLIELGWWTFCLGIPGTRQSNGNQGTNKLKCSNADLENIQSDAMYFPSTFRSQQLGGFETCLCDTTFLINCLEKIRDHSILRYFYEPFILSCNIPRLLWQDVGKWLNHRRFFKLALFIECLWQAIDSGGCGE